MPKRVVKESHYSGDEYTLVPSVKEFNDLTKKVSDLSRAVSALSSKVTALERGEKAIATALQKQDKSMSSLREDLMDELSNGAWKQIMSVRGNATRLQRPYAA